VSLEVTSETVSDLVGLRCCKSRQGTVESMDRYSIVGPFVVFAMIITCRPRSFDLYSLGSLVNFKLVTLHHDAIEFVTKHSDVIQLTRNTV